MDTAHYKGDTGGQVARVEGKFGPYAIYWLKGHLYGVWHADVQPGDGPW